MTALPGNFVQSTLNIASDEYDPATHVPRSALTLQQHHAILIWRVAVLTIYCTHLLKLMLRMGNVSIARKSLVLEEAFQVVAKLHHKCMSEKCLNFSVSL